MPQNNARPNKILVVDDDVRIRDLLRRYLMQEGFEVMLAEDGKSLNRVLQRDSVDLIVLDLMMPGEDGLSICRRLRANGDRTPIIMLSAKSEDVDRFVGLEVGADDYLGKPFNPRELLARIHAVLRRRPPTEVPGPPSHDKEVVNFGPFEFDLSLRTLRKEGRWCRASTRFRAMAGRRAGLAGSVSLAIEGRSQLLISGCESPLRVQQMMGTSVSRPMMRCQW